MLPVDGKDLTPAFFTYVAAQLAAFAAGEQERRYRAPRRARRGLTVRGTWLTDKGLAEAGRMEKRTG